MHNKFLVFGNMVPTETCVFDDGEHYTEFDFEACAVLTGSANYSESSSLHEENLLYVESKQLASAYHNRWRRIVSISEKLDWTSEYVEPEFRWET